MGYGQWKKKIHTKRYVVYKEEKKKRERSVWVGGHTSPSVHKVQ